MFGSLKGYTGLFSNNNTSLFGTNTGETSGNMFSSTTGSIFGKSNEEKKLKFGEGGTGSLFGGKPLGSQSIFNFQKEVPPENKQATGGLLFGGIDDGSGDEEALERAQKVETDPTKSTGKYVY